MAKLTIKKIKSLKLGNTAKEYADGHIPGLYFELGRAARQARLPDIGMEEKLASC